MAESGYTCELCDYHCDTEEAEEKHLKTKRHFVEFLKYHLWENEEFLVRDKKHVKVSCVEVEDCIPTISFRARENQEVKLTLLVSVHEEAPHPVWLQACTFLHPTRVFSLEDEVGVCASLNQTIIQPGNTYTVVLRCLAATPVTLRVPLALKFQQASQAERLFTIVRFVEATFYEDGGDNLEPVAPYFAVPPLPKLPESDRIIHGKRPESDCIQELELKKVLQEYPLEKEILLVYEHGMKPWEDMDEGLYDFLHTILHHLESPISEATYWGCFSTLLYLEEIQMRIDIRTYDMEGVALERSPLRAEWYTLEVPGVVEGRPAVLKGDKIFVRDSACKKVEGGEIVEYEGYVCEIIRGTLLINFSKRFQKMYIRGMKFDVRFTYNRLPLRLMHRAIGMVEQVELWNFVLPTRTHPSEPALRLPKIHLFNKKIESNPEQYAAVKNIILGLHRPYPYLLFGPPGTGKTVTLVEALKQICSLIPSSHILVVTPSNSACDILAERLLDHMMVSEIFRMYSASVDPNKMSKKLTKVSNYNPNAKKFWYPSAGDLMKYKIIVSTLAGTGKLVSADFPLNHFTHIFVDEAGQCLEPECLIPVVGLMSPWDPTKRGVGGHLVIAGDPKQLGPVIRSRLAQKYKLDVSLLERLMDCELYQRQANGHYSPMLLTKLLKNFRSHKDIIEVPNRLFYDRELQAQGDELITHCMTEWEQLPRRGCPLIFHGVSGRDLRELSCPSYYNPEEIRVVISYVAALLEGKSGLGVRIKCEDIGIVSPYRKQVLKIRALLAKRGIEGVTVGSTEEFQGQERLVMIITTVRSDSNLLKNDFRHRLGFLKNHKRFNVAVTRAKALLIMVGNPYTLRQDVCWRRLLEFCIKKGAYCGVEYGDGDEHLRDIEERFAAVGIGEDLSADDDLVFRGQIPITQKTLQEEPQWREEL